MKFMLTTGWPIGSRCLDPGTTLNFNLPKQFWSDAERLAEGRDIPADAILLDSGAVRAWRKAYHEVGAPGSPYAPWLFPKVAIEDWWDTDEFRPLVREAVEKILTGPIKQET
jgi:hypothetical protein